MGGLLDLFVGSAQGGAVPPTPELILLCFLFAFIQGQLVAWIYMYTHSGLSYSRAFVQSIILITLIVCMAMLVIGNNLIVAVGLIGALAVIRFRNILKDTRDTSFIFLALIMGLASGTGNFLYSTLGTLIVALVMIYLHVSTFGSKHMSDGFIRFEVSEGKPAALIDVFRRYCRSTRLVSQRVGEGGRGEVSYRLVLRDPARSGELVRELEKMTGIANVTFVLQEEQGEL